MTSFAYYRWILWLSDYDDCIQRNRVVKRFSSIQFDIFVSLLSTVLILEKMNSTFFNHSPPLSSSLPLLMKINNANRLDQNIVWNKYSKAISWKFSKFLFLFSSLLYLSSSFAYRNKNWLIEKQSANFELNEFAKLTEKHRKEREKIYLDPLYGRFQFNFKRK